MKITIATGPIHAFPPHGAAGVQKVFSVLARQFVARGHSVAVLARAWPGQCAEEASAGMTILRRGGYEQGTNIWIDLLKDLFYAVRAQRFVPEGDVVVVNDFWLPVLLGRCRKRPGKLVVAAHRFPKNQYWMYRHVDAIIAVSKPVAAAICLQQPDLAPKVFTINNPLDTSELRFQHRSDRKRLVIGSLGRLHPEKGAHLLVESFRRLVAKGVDAELRIAGPWQKAAGGGGREYFDRLKALGQGLPAQIIGPLRDDEVPDFYGSIDIFCLPSLADQGEAMPLAPLEAMACGAVPIVSQIEAFMEYIEVGVNGLVFNHRAKDAPDLLANALEKLVSDPEKRAAMSVAARDTAERFAPERISCQYLEVFDSIAGREA